MTGFILAHGKAADAVARHMPCWKAAFSEIVLISPEDDPLTNAHAIGKSERRGHDSIKRMQVAVEWAAAKRSAAILEYDTLVFTGKLPDHFPSDNQLACSSLRQHVGENSALFRRYGHSPWMANGATWRRLLTAAGDEQFGWSDRWLALACYNAGIELVGVAGSYSNDEPWTPTILEVATEIVRLGAPLVHGVKTLQDFNAVTTARRAYEKHQQIIAGSDGNIAGNLKLGHYQHSFGLAQQHHRAGRLKEAEALYREILALQPKHADALHFLGVLATQLDRQALGVELIHQSLHVSPNNFAAHSNLGEAYRQTGQFEAAIASFRQALELKPDHPEAHNNLGVALKEQGKLDEAAASYCRALEFKPDYPEAHNNLGIVLAEQGRPDEAMAKFQRALQLQPDYAEAHVHLGHALRQQGRLDEAIAAYRRALELRPDYPEAHSNLGNALRERGRLDEALVSCRHAIQLQPGKPEAHLHLADTLRERGQLDEAVAEYRRTLELKPDHAEACNHLGIALALRGQLDEAMAVFRRALELDPGNPDIHNNLGNAQREQGQLDEAISIFRHAFQLMPEHAVSHDNLVYSLHFHPAHDAASIAEEHQHWNRQFADPLRPSLRPHANDRNPGRRLRIGYVSPDFRFQAESFFVVPLLEAHDHQQFEIHGYASVRRPDEVTERLRRSADIWHDVQGQSDHHLAEQIRDDGIDILVDLTMHMAHNRLRVFARKPAPVQVTWLAYPGSTGLETMDYRLTDRYMDPPAIETPFYSEKSVHLPDCWCCYHPLTNEPATNSPPAGDTAPITFGCLNNFCKINDQTVALFASALRVVEGSRLLLLVPEGSARTRILDQFSAHGVRRDRVTCVAAVWRPDYLKLYHGIDIALDPLPYNGITTTCDALWMGVPVVSLAGKTAAGRAGLSILSMVGLSELASQNPDEFAGAVKRLANDRSGLAKLRQELRSRMEASSLMNAPRFARNMEAAYREMWQRWCMDTPSSSQ